MTTQNVIPAGYRQKYDGSLIPESMIRPIDRLRDELVQELVHKARDVRQVLLDFKAETFSDIGAFVAMSADEYGVDLGGNKGNVTLQSFDGRYKIQRAIAESIGFDERLQVAKALIDECIHKWTADSQDELKVLINDAFRVDKEGNINTGRVLGLRRLQITDTTWMRAMTAIGESIQSNGSKSYVRIYERQGNEGKWQAISLDLAIL